MGEADGNWHSINIAHHYLHCIHEYTNALRSETNSSGRNDIYWREYFHGVQSIIS